jgi:hypothetical protein
MKKRQKQGYLDFGRLIVAVFSDGISVDFPPPPRDFALPPRFLVVTFVLAMQAVSSTPPAISSLLPLE